MLLGSSPPPVYIQSSLSHPKLHFMVNTVNVLSFEWVTLLHVLAKLILKKEILLVHSQALRQMLELSRSLQHLCLATYGTRTSWIGFFMLRWSVMKMFQALVLIKTRGESPTGRVGPQGEEGQEQEQGEEDDGHKEVDEENEVEEKATT